MLNLEEKKQFYIGKAEEIRNYNYSNEIEEMVNLYRNQLVNEYEGKRQKDLDKIEAYIDLLNVLIVENEGCSKAEEIDSNEEINSDEENIEEGGN